MTDRVRSDLYRSICFSDKDEKCKLCGSTDDIEVHHVDGNPLNNDTTNLLPVCESCHKKIHTGEEGFEKWSEKLANESRYPMGRWWSESKRVSVRLPLPMFDWVEKRATETGASRSAVIRRCIEDQYGVDDGLVWTDDSETEHDTSSGLESARREIKRLKQQNQKLRDRLARDIERDPLRTELEEGLADITG